MSSLDKVLAAAGLLDPAALGTPAKGGEDEAHEHLMRECPWYAHVSGGGSGDPGKHCDAHHDGQAVRLTPRTPEASTVVKPTVKPGGPGLFHIKGRTLPPYMEHLWFHLVKRYGKHDAYRVANGIVHKWKEGINPGGWKRKDGKPSRVHPDVQAAASKNIAEWEKDRADAHGGAGKVKATVALAVPAGTAPGARPLPPPGLRQAPSPAVSPAPLRPPPAPLPTAAEVTAMIGKLPECSDPSLSASARAHLDAAAVKLGKNDTVGALHMLRSAQSDIYAAHKTDMGAAGAASYTANVFTRPPAGSAVADANAVMQRAARQEMAWRAVEQLVSGAIHRIRQRYFHGQLNGTSQMARFAGETPLGRVLRLAGEAD